MTLTQMLARVRIYVDDRNSDKWTDATELTAHINTAQARVQRIINDADEDLFMGCKKYSVVSTEDAWEFTLPTDFLRLILLERLVTNGDPIPVNWVNFRQRHEHVSADPLWPTVPSRPNCYLRGIKFGVIDPADSYTLRMWYIILLPDLSDGAAVSEIPLEWHDLVCLEAASIALGSIDRQLPSELEKQRIIDTGALQISITKREQQRPRYVNYVPD